MSDKKIKHLEAEVRQSRAMLASRWNTLELEIAGLANSAKEEVTQTVQQAKESMSLRHQIAKRPWVMLAGSIATGLVLSRMRGIRSLAMLGLVTPIFKNALNSESMSQAFRPQSSSYSGYSSRTGRSNLKSGGFIDVVKSKAFRSLAELAREFARSNLPRSVFPVVEQVISHALDSFLVEETPKYSSPSTTKAGQSLGDENDAFSIH